MLLKVATDDILHALSIINLYLKCVLLRLDLLTKLQNSHEDLDKESLLFLAIRSHEQISFADMTYDQ